MRSRPRKPARVGAASVSAAGLLTLCAASGCTPRPTAPAAPIAPIRFTDVTREVGLAYHYSPGGDPPLNILQVTCGAGAAFLDYDGDGWQDILCVGLPHPALFRSDRGRRFLDVTRQAGIPQRARRWNGCATGDWDNDGRVDLLLTAYNDVLLLRNGGAGRFEDATAAMGLRMRGWATSAAFADVDRDGWLDLYIGRYVHFEPGMPQFSDNRGVRLPLGPLAYRPQRGVLYRSRGGRRFEEVTRAAGLDTAHGKALGVAFADADADGDDDLFVANDEMPQDYFENIGGRFRNISMENGTAFSDEGTRQGGMGVDFGDYDGDGRLDLFLANAADEPKSLYANLGTGMFESVGFRAGVSQTTRPWVAFGTKLADLDHDGLLDLMIVNGHIQDAVAKVDPANSYPQRPQLFLNAEGGRFREVSAGVGPDFQRPLVGRALALGDYDNDGDLDALVGNLGGGPVLLRSDRVGQPTNWLMLQLTGAGRSNRMAFGARVEITAGGRRQVREVRTDGSYLAAHDARVHFGLGKAGHVDGITIRWPSGRRQTLPGAPANQVLAVREAP